MPCYKPLDGYASAYQTATGGKRIVFSPEKAEDPRSIIPIPCGRCIGCRLEKAKSWALRCYHEASLYGNKNAYITLTYADPSLPENYTLQKDHFQKFIRALRQKTGEKIRYYMCGEYGNLCCQHNHWTDHQPPDRPDIPQCQTCTTGRPHYHAIIFNFDFPDKKLFCLRKGNRVYTSALCTDLWGRGHSEISGASFHSASYVAQYILKKQNGKWAEKAYTDQGRIAPYTQMSLRPGIGKKWYDQYKTDLWPHDYAVTPDGRKMPVPDYYTNLLKKEDPDLYRLLKDARLEKAINNPDNTDERLETREIVATAKLKRNDRE